MLKDALNRLNLKKPLSREKARQSLVSIPKKSVFTKEEREPEILRQLLLSNPCALDICTVDEKGELIGDDRNTNDVICDIFASSHEEVRADLARTLNNSAKSIPFILPAEEEGEKTELCLWQFKNIVKTWQVRIENDSDLSDQPQNVQSEKVQEYFEERIFQYPTRIVSFLKVTKEEDDQLISKSFAINKAFYDQNFQVFRDKRSLSAQQPLQRVGYVDLQWMSPEIITQLQGEDKNTLKKSLITMLNVHGNSSTIAEKKPEITKFIFTQSNVLVIFASSDSCVESLFETVGVGESTDCSFLIISHEKNDESRKSRKSLEESFNGKDAQNPNKKKQRIKFVELDNDFVGDDFYEILHDETFKFVEEISEKSVKSLQSIDTELTTWDNILVDMRKDDFRRPKDQTAQIIELLARLKKKKMADTYGILKPKILFYQDMNPDPKVDTAMLYVRLDKELNRFIESSSKEIGRLTEEENKEQSTLTKKEKLKGKLCKKYTDHLKQPGEEDQFIGVFVRILKEYMAEADELEKLVIKTQSSAERKEIKDKIGKLRRQSALFLDMLAEKLDQESFKEMAELRKSHSQVVRKIVELEKNESNKDIQQEKQELKNQEKKLADRILVESFGLEHIFRELSLIWTFCQMENLEDHIRVQSKREQFYNDNIEFLPRLCAEQLLNGTPIELMDGDCSYIYTEWIRSVFRELKLKLEQRYNATKGFVTSIMGLQSSGKSTLLNTQYNLKFAVAAGRCTKGIFMLPVIFSRELKQKYKEEHGKELHFMLLFDTEGLRAQELGISQTNRSKDGEMATACLAVADTTFINSMNFQNAELFDILSIVINMIIRYKNSVYDSEDQKAYDVSATFVNQGISDSQYKSIDLGISVRQNDLNHMTQHALQRLGWQEKGASVIPFTKIVPRSIDEQFIEPLFVDEGNIRRYSYDYVAKVHALRLKTLDWVVNPNSQQKQNTIARDLDEIAEKIVQVYNSILKDDFAFQFRNDEELTCKLKVQDKFNELGVIMIDMLREREKFQEDRINTETQLNEVLDEVKKRYNDWVGEQIEKNKGIMKYNQQYGQYLDEMFLKFKDENERVLASRQSLKTNIDNFEKKMDEEFQKQFVFWQKQNDPEEKAGLERTRAQVEQKFSQWFEKITKEFPFVVPGEPIKFAEIYRSTYKIKFDPKTGTSRQTYFQALANFADKFQPSIIEIWGNEVSKSFAKEGEEQKSDSKAKAKRSITGGVFRMNDLQMMLPAQVSFLVTNQKQNAKEMIDKQRIEFHNEVQRQLEELFKEAVNEKYHQAVFGKVLTVGENIINRLLADESKGWEIVPSNFYKPLMVDKYMHTLVMAYEAEDKLQSKCCDPQVYKEEIVEPNLKHKFYDFQLTVQQANLISQMLSLHIDATFRDYVVNGKKKRMKEILKNAQENGEFQLLTPKQENEQQVDKIFVLNIFKKKQFANSTEAVDQLILFLTKFDNFLQEACFGQIKDEVKRRLHSPKEDKNANKSNEFQSTSGSILVKELARLFRDMWKDYMNPIVDDPTFFKADEKIYPDSTETIDSDEKFKMFKEQLKGDQNRTLWKLVSQKIHDQIKDEKLPNVTQLGCLEDISLSDILEITNELKEKQYGCTKQCPFCGVVCESPESEDHDSKHTSKYHYYPGLFGTKVVKNGSPDHLLINDKTCIGMKQSFKSLKSNALNQEESKNEEQKVEQISNILTDKNEVMTIDQFEKSNNWSFAETKITFDLSFFDKFIKDHSEELLKRHGAKNWTKPI